MPAVHVLLAATANLPLATHLIKTAARKENIAPNAFSKVHQCRSPISNSMEDVLAIIYNFTPDTNNTEHFLALLNTLLGYQIKHCYLGESPTLENKCPVCNADLMYVVYYCLFMQLFLSLVLAVPQC
jgi:hypothetical protein